MPKGKSTKNKRKKIKDNTPQNMDIEKEEIPKKEENENIELLEKFNNFRAASAIFKVPGSRITPAHVKQ